ncbi:NUDIX hydrolase [Yoonia sp. R2331]|uniref:NUDIX hydrolase n=1 Tax=Yoonia sp. R2331 TaxID=3237238 RepID=UPI0034E50144
MVTTEPFSGSKVALFLGDQLLITLRDDFDHIPFPNLWDFPGGARDNDETPFQTLAREVMEEVGLVLPREAILWESAFPAANNPDARIWFFVAQMPAGTEADIVFGDEGQGWKLVSLADFLEMKQVVPTFAGRLRVWMAETGGLSEG